MTAPGALLRTVSRRMRLARALRRGAAGALVAVAAAAAAPRPGALGAAMGASLFALAPLLARRPRAADAARLVDQRTGAAERFTTWLELAGRGPFAAPLERQCAEIAAAADPRRVVPFRLWRGTGPLAALAAAVVLGAALAASPDPLRAAERGEATRVLAAASAVDDPGIKEGLEGLARDLAAGRLDLAAVRALRRRAEEEAALGDALAEALAGQPSLARLAAALANEAREDAAEAARELASRGDPTTAARALAGRDATRPLSDALAARDAERAAEAARALAVRLAAARAAGLRAAAARLEAVERRCGPPAADEPSLALGGAPDATASAAARAGIVETAGPSAPRAARAPDQEADLPPDLETAVRRYFSAETERP
jgi:hypothetical protein